MAAGFLPPVVAVLTASIGEFSAKMGQAKGEMAAVEGSASKMGALGKTAILGLAVGAGVVAVESVKMASSFQATMNLIQTQAHAGKEEVDKMSQAVLDLAPTVGIGPQKLAEGLYHVESTGLRGSAALDVLKASAQEAAIGMADFDDVTFAMSGVMSVALKDVNNAADGVAYLNTIVGTGDMRMGDLAKAIGTGVLPVFKSAQLGMRDFGSAMAVMTDNSMPAEQAANHLKTAVMLLQNQSGPATKALASIGIVSGQLAQDLAKPDGFLVAIQDIKHHLEESGKSAVEQGQIIAKAFGGARSAATIEEFIGQVDKLAGKYHEMGNVAQRAKQQQEDWAATQQTFKQKMAEVGAQFQVWIIQIGQVLLPILSTMADWFMGSVKWLGDHKDVLILIGSIALPILAVGLWGAAVAAWNFTAAILANPITWIVLAVGVLIFGLIELVLHLKEVGQFFKWLWDTVWMWTTDTVPPIVDFIVSAFHHAVDWIVNTWSDFIGFWVDLWNGIWKWSSDRVSDVSNFITSTFDDVVNWIKDTWNSIPQFFSDMWDKVVNFFKEAPQKIGYALGHAAGEVVKALNDAGNAVENWVTVTLPDNFSRGMTNLGHWFRNQGKTLLDGFLGGIDEGAKAVWNWVTVTLPDNFNRGMTNLGHWFRNQGKSLLDGFLDGITTGAKAVWNWVTVTLPENFDRGMTNLGNWFRNQGKSILDGFLGGIEEGADGVWHWLTVTLPDNFDRGLTNLGNWVRNQGKSIVDGFVGGLRSAWDAVWKAVTDFCDGFIRGFKDALGIHSPSTIMAEIGRDLLRGLVNGIWEGFRAVWEALSSLVRTIGGFFSGAATWLWSAGYNILVGLYNGLISSWNNVTNFIGGIAGWIAAHKGPIEVDRVLLAPHGNAIMEGLLGGLKAGGTKVQSYLDNFTTGIGSTSISGSMSMTGSGSGGLAGGVGSGGGGTTVVNHVTVQGTVVAERDLQTLIQTLTLQYNARNSSNGLAMSGVR